MRELKFRVWFHEPDTGHGVFVEADEAFRDNYIDWFGSELAPTDECSIIEQFTGLYDKNGTEIYEGDVVCYHSYHNLGHVQEKTIGRVVWGRTGDSDEWAHSKHYEWTVRGDSLADVADSDYPDEAYCEVIGNIHDNPELLEA
jgi:uncharacterized phage protein (TIGR01671 family)